MMQWLFKRWRKRQRDLDLKILWPVCKEQAVDLDCARIAFLFHCELDDAWTKDFDEDELRDFVGGLT